MEEIFKAVKGYEGYYEVSNFGRVRSTSYKGVRILKPCKMKNGYLNVILCVNQIKVHKNIHRLVAEAFIPNPLNLETVNHKDGNKENNTVENLEWLSFEDNSRLANKGQLTKEKVLSIPFLIKEGLTTKEIANVLGTSQRTISFVLSGEHWNNLGIDFTVYRKFLKGRRKRRKVNTEVN